jgi:2-phosphosulfolactate phosphatase
VTAHILPELLDPSLLPGSSAVVIDLLRASTTITRALDAGAAAVVPCLETADAIRLRDSGELGPCLLGGERRGVLIPGFDLGNSPAEYTPVSVAGRTLLFTTTNGTRAVLRARGDAHSPGAERILIGCLANRAGLCDLLAGDGRPIRLICAGTGGAVSLDDCLCAGAIIDGLLGLAAAGGAGGGAAPTFDVRDDQAQLLLAAYRAVADPATLAGALHASIGGRNLASIGLASDVDDAARMDITATVPELDASGRRFIPAAVLSDLRARMERGSR